MRRWQAALVAALMVVACGSQPSTSSAPTETSAIPSGSSGPWWNDRVFYEVFVRSFKDSDGDGIGDLGGLMESLDYLNDGDPATDSDLGVTGVWLMPIFPSPSYHGYDVTDYRSINPDYGTMADFEAFLRAAHDRGIAVLIDLVINHTSTENPWFQASATGEPKHEGWYLWSDTDPGTVSPWSGAPAWHPRDGRYYYGLFWEGMPDLNLENPDVTAELRDIARFWLEDVGVDGFRLDAARHLIEDGTVLADTPETLAWLEGFTDYVHSVAPHALVLGEVWSPTPVVAEYVPDALDLAFEFDLSAAGGGSIRTWSAEPLEQALTTVEAAYPELQYATFLTNHDMNRLMSEVGGDVRIAELAATWLLTAPGVPFLYYGEEVGLGGAKPDEQIRTPMPWTGDGPGVGFTTGTPWEPAYPGYDTVNVASEDGDPNSLLSHYRTLIRAREANEALRRGDVIDVETSSEAVAAFLRSEGDQHVLVVLNLSPQYVENLSLDLAGGPLSEMKGVAPIVGPPASAPMITDTGGLSGYQPLESIAPYGYLVLAFTPEESSPPSSTTTSALPAEEATALHIVESLYQAFAGGDAADVERLVSADAVIVNADGSRVSVGTVLPPDQGFDESWDWDGDGTVTVGDLVLAQNAWGSVILVDLDWRCVPDAGLVSCVVAQNDVFGKAGGLVSERLSQAYRIDDDLITELRLGASSRTAEDQQFWLETFARYESWISGVHPDLYRDIFREPCCSGSPDGMLFTRRSIDLQSQLLSEWVAEDRP